MTEQDTKPKSVAELAKEQGVSRATIYARKERGWTEEEIAAGKRGTKKGRRVLKDYDSQFSGKLGGFSAREVARYNKISQSGLYYRLHHGIEFALPTKKNPRKRSK